MCPVCYCWYCIILHTYITTTTLQRRTHNDSPHRSIPPHGIPRALVVAMDSAIVVSVYHSPTAQTQQNAPMVEPALHLVGQFHMERLRLSYQPRVRPLCETECCARNEPLEVHDGPLGPLLFGNAPYAYETQQTLLGADNEARVYTKNA